LFKQQEEDVIPDEDIGCSRRTDNIKMLLKTASNKINFPKDSPITKRKLSLYNKTSNNNITIFKIDQGTKGKNSCCSKI